MKYVGVKEYNICNLLSNGSENKNETETEQSRCDRKCDKIGKSVLKGLIVLFVQLFWKSDIMSKLKVLKNHLGLFVWLCFSQIGFGLIFKHTIL